MILLLLLMTSLASLAESLERCWRPTVRRGTADWVERDLRITDDSGTRVSRFRFDGREYLRGIFDAVDDPDVEEITIMGPAQFGKTTLTLALLASRPCCDPGPGMFCGPDAAYAAEKARLLYHYAEATPDLAGRIPPKHKRRERREINFDNCTIYLAWSGSPQTMSGRPVRFVMCSELDRWTDDPKHGASAQVIRARVQSFQHSYKIIRESTPTDETSQIASFLDSSNNQRFWCPCPHCGRYQELRQVPHRDGPHAGRGGIVGLQDARGGWLDPEAARRKAYYVCESGCRIESHAKPGMISRGQWVPHGCTLDESGRLAGAPTRSKRHSGFAVSGLMMHFKWGQLAAQYLTARSTNSLRTYWNNTLGLPWIERAKTPRWRELARKLSGDHRRGRIPAAAWFVTAAADVQSDRCYWSVKAWGERGRRWTIDLGCVRRSVPDPSASSLREIPSDLDDDAPDQAPPDSDLAQLSALLVARRWPVAGQNPWNQTELPAALVGIDSGHRIRAVHRWTREQKDGRVRAVAGDPRATAGRPWHSTVIESDARTGKPYAGGLVRWWVNTDQFKTDLLAAYATPADDPAAFLLPSDLLDSPDGEDYLRQITNERVTNEVTPGGRAVRRWVEIDKTVGNHYWDCEVYHAALADMVTGGDFSLANLQALAAEASPRAPSKSDPPPPPDDFAARP